MKLNIFNRLFIAFILVLTLVISVEAKELTKAVGISFKETPDKDMVIIHLDSPATYHEIKSKTNTIIDVLNSKFVGKENVKLILKKSVKLVRAINIKGKENIARFMIILNNRFPVTSYKKNNDIIVEIDKSDLVKRNEEILDKMKRYASSRSTNPMVDYHYNQGRTYARLGKWQDAIDEYVKALQLDPRNEKIKVSMDVAKENIKSEDQLEKAMRQYKNGEYSEAIRSYRAILTMWPDDISAHFNLGKSYMKLNKYAESMVEFEKVLSLNPDYENAKQLYDLVKRRKILNSFSVNVKNQNIVDVLRSLLHGTGYNLIVEDGVSGRKIDANFTDYSLEQALQNIIVKNGFSYTINDNVIKIIPEDVNPEQKVYSQANLVDLELVNALEVLSKMMKKNFILDKSINKKLKDKITIYIKDELTVGEIFDLLMKTNDLFPVPYSENTYIIMDKKEAIKQNKYVIKKWNVFKLNDVKPSVIKANIFQMSAIKDCINPDNVQADDDNMILSVYDTEKNTQLIGSILKKLDIKKQQVTIALKMLEVSKTAKKVLGLDLTNNNTQTTLNGDSPLIFDVKKLGKISSLDLNAKIQMLENNDYVKTLSSPIVRVVDGESANIHSGKKIPVKDVTQNPQYEGGKVVGYTSQEAWTDVDIGITLDVKPTIHHDGDITLDINIKQNDADLTNISSGSHFVTTGKEQKTTLRIKDGETVVMGGLINTQHGKNHIRVPFFYKIPVIGRLFSRKSDNKIRSELIIYLTAFLVNKEDVEVSKSNKEEENRDLRLLL